MEVYRSLTERVDSGILRVWRFSLFLKKNWAEMEGTGPVRAAVQRSCRICFPERPVKSS